MRKWTLIAAVIVMAIGLALYGEPVFAQASGGGTTAGGGGGGTGAPTTPTGPDHGKEIDLPIGGPAAGFAEEDPQPPEEDDTPEFYDEDIPTRSESIIYVIDQSGSMGWGSTTYTGLDGRPTTGTPLDRAKCELIRSINALTEDYYFNIIAYDCDTRRWRASRQQATPANKASAAGWIGALRDMGATGTGPAMALALADKDNLTVVLLSDGAPNCGANGFSGHRNMIRSANTQHAVIHTFGIGAYGEFEQFLRDVASDAGGRYVAVP